MSECDCPLMLVHCDMEDPVCNQHDDELPDDDPWYEPPPGPMRCDGPLKSRCFDLFCREVGCVEMPRPPRHGPGRRGIDKSDQSAGHLR